MQQAMGAMAALAVLGLLLVGPMVLVVSASANDPVAERCLSSANC